mgnify:CR=1 FL=1
MEPEGIMYKIDETIVKYLWLKNDSAYGATEQHSFLELCEFAESVIKRRIEQLEEVAMVDVTGILERQVQIVPDQGQARHDGLSIGDMRIGFIF